MDLDAYVAEHAGEWRRLEHLARRRRLSAAEADELITLYQRAATHLSVIRSRSPDPALVARLSRIVLAARGAATGRTTFSWHAVARFFTVAFPLEVYRTRRWWLSVMVGFVAFAVLLGAYVAGNPEVPLAFMSEEEIDALVNSEFAGYYTEFMPQNFAFAVWVNNAWVSAVCLASGVLLLPVLYILATNAFNVGMVGGIMVGHGRADVFFGLIAPHGLLELTCVFVAAGTGLRIGWSWIAPGRHRSRGRALAETARSAMLVALGLVVVLAVCGLLEGFVTPSGLPTVVRVGIGLIAWLGFFAYVFVRGALAAQAGEETDVGDGLRVDTAPTA